MTAYTSSALQFDVAKILTMGLKASGLCSLYQAPDTTLLGHARDQLDLILDYLAVDGVTAKTTGFETVAVVAGTSAYQLPASVLEVLAPAWLAAAGEPEPPNSQYPLQIVGSEEWTGMADAATGTPGYLYPYKGTEGIEARLYPVPTDSGTLRLHVQRMLMDAGPGDNTLELERYWAAYFVQQLAGELAQGAGMDQKATMHLARAEAMKQRCLRQDTTNVNSQITVEHATVWDDL
jgi:hypothetical protein